MIDKAIPIYQRGITGEQALQGQYPGGEIHKFFRTDHGGRYIDVLKDGVAHEAKVGYTCLSKFVKKQILMDVLLRDSDKLVNEVVWHFYKSDITGRIGLSPQLRKFLEKYSIEIVEHTLGG